MLRLTIAPFFSASLSKDEKYFTIQSQPAQAGNVLRLMLLETLWLALIGIVIGLPNEWE